MYLFAARRSPDVTSSLPAAGKRLPLLLIALGALAGCTATKEARVHSALTDAGFSASTASCMAQPLARDLSTGQLRAMGRVAGAIRNSNREYSDREILNIVRRDLDPETVAVVMRAGIGCFLRG